MLDSVLGLLTKNKKALGGGVLLTGVVGGLGLILDKIELTEGQTNTVAGTVVLLGGVIGGALIAFLKGKGGPPAPGAPSA